MTEQQLSPEMVERVARAIYDEMPNGGEIRRPATGMGSLAWEKVFVPDPWEDAPDRHEDCRRQARAAIEALREPTPEMLRLIRNPWGEATSFAQDCSENGYRRGINAALAGPK